MRRAVIAAALVAVAASCGGGEERRSFPPSTTAPSSTTTSTTAAPADLAAANVKLTPVVDIRQGTALAVRRDDPSIYIAQQTGVVSALRDGTMSPVLDLSGEVSSVGERGLLGLTFSPDGSKLYVHYSDRDGDTTLEEFGFANGVADLASRRRLLQVAQPQPNHNGGELRFGPDQMLYLALGDGGGAGDQGAGHAPEGNGQSLDTLLGKILRIDPSPTLNARYTIPDDNPFADGGGRAEIWAYGLRNPWRFSFDRETDDVWVADVGQNAFEEVDVVTFAQAGGANFGWPVFEGTHEFRGGSPRGQAIGPVFETSHSAGDCSITGGFVYRGKSIPNLVGAYVFTDYCNGDIRAIKVEGGRVVAQRSLGISGDNVSSFGEDADGELYVISQTEGIFRIEPA